MMKRVGCPLTKFELETDPALLSVITCPAVGFLLVNKRKITSFAATNAVSGA